MSRFAPLPMVVPLLGAALAMLCSQRRAAQRAISVVSLVIALGASIALLVDVDTSGPLVARIGAWSPSIGISYVIDRFSGLMLVIALLTLLAVLVFAIGEASSKSTSPIFYPVYLVLAAGVCAAFSTGDLFHLFVAFEILLMASYVLLTLDGSEAQVRAATTYVIINTIESVVLLVAIGLVYAATGTLNMAELPSRLAALDPGVSTGLQLLLLVAFGLKAAVFPLFFWLPDSYPTARSPITAVFAGLLTKVGVYAIVRTQTQLFPQSDRTVLLWIAGFTMVVGVLGAIAQNEMKRILSFHIVSQIGYMVMGVAIGGAAAIAATIFFLIHQIPVKTSLFLVDGMVEHSTGTSRLERLSGLLHQSGFLAFLFLLPALSLSGIPPFSGFVAKLGLVTAGFDHGQGVLVAIAIACSLLTLVSMTKIWVSAFWGPRGAVDLRRDRGAAPPNEGDSTAAASSTQTLTKTATQTSARTPAQTRTRWPAPMMLATVALVTVGLAVAFAAGPIYALCERAAADLVAPVHQVTDGSAR
jgi:multicomponent Na+:H+ antiporter subunit D